MPFPSLGSASLGGLAAGACMAVLTAAVIRANGPAKATCQQADALHLAAGQHLLADHRRASSTRIRQRVGLILTDMLGDDDEDSRGTDPEKTPSASEADHSALTDDAPGPAPSRALGQRTWPMSPPESQPYLATPAPQAAKQQHVPRHAAPPPSLPTRLTPARSSDAQFRGAWLRGAKLPGFAAKSSRAAW